jgi:HEAT repeats
MNRIAKILTATLVVTSAQQASAIDLGFGLFKRKSQPSAPSAPNTSKSDSSLKIKQLVATLQSDPDTDRRKVAAETLRTLDPRNNADVIPTLVSTLQNDPNAGVRSIAAESLGEIKSVYPTAGAALESSEKSDPDANVRAMAKSALWQYHLNGYKTSPSASLPNQTGEPPLAAQKPAGVPLPPTKSQPVVSESSFRPITQGMGKGANLQPTAEPPLAKPRIAPVTVPEVKPPMPMIVAPPIPVPMQMPEPTTTLPVPKSAPPISIPDVPKFPAGDGTPTVIPPKR